MHGPQWRVEVWTISEHLSINGCFYLSLCVEQRRHSHYEQDRIQLFGARLAAKKRRRRSRLELILIECLFLLAQ